MSKPIPLRDYVVGGHVTEETVNAIAALNRGEAMVTDEPFWQATPYRCWTRRKHANGQWERNNGQNRATVQEAVILSTLQCAAASTYQWARFRLAVAPNVRARWV